MKVTETIQINAENSKIWETLKSFQSPEKYISSTEQTSALEIVLKYLRILK